jgi:hypothetical protein
VTYGLPPEKKAERVADLRAELKFLVHHHQTVGARITELKAILTECFDVPWEWWRVDHGS